MDAETLRAQALLAVVMSWTWEGGREEVAGVTPRPLFAHWDGGAVQ